MTPAERVRRLVADLAEELELDIQRSGRHGPSSHIIVNRNWAQALIAAAADVTTVDLLTDDERHAIQTTAALWNLLCRITADGPSRQADLGELAIHIHAIQHAVMAQASARADPESYRLLGAGPPGNPTPQPRPAPTPRPNPSH